MSHLRCMVSLKWAKQPLVLLNGDRPEMVSPMKQSTYLLVYKDGPKAHEMYFGPFTDRNHVQRFADDLPTPLPGGFKKYTVTQPFTHNEADMVTSVIQANREKLHVN